MKLIDLENKRKEKKDKKRKEVKDNKAPESHCVTKGHDGKSYFNFSVTYAYKNKNYSFEIWATSKADAEKRIHAIKHHPVECNQVLDSGVWNGVMF